jgi:hypothetical protein
MQLSAVLVASTVTHVMVTNLKNTFGFCQASSHCSLRWYIAAKVINRNLVTVAQDIKCVIITDAIRNFMHKLQNKKVKSILWV